MVPRHANQFDLILSSSQGNLNFPRNELFGNFGDREREIVILKKRPRKISDPKGARAKNARTIARTFRLLAEDDLFRGGWEYT